MTLLTHMAINGKSGGLSWTRQVAVRLVEDDRRRPHGAFLAKMRRWAPSSAASLGLIFTLHCTRSPNPAPVRGPGRFSRSVPADARAFEEDGEASWYGGNGDGFSGKPTASGEIFDPQAFTCAHRTLPLGTFLEVENLENSKRVVVKVNDRGPFAKGRILDLSKGAAVELGFLTAGFTQVRIHSVDAAGLPTALDPALDQTNPYTIQVAALAEKSNVDRLSRELERGSFGPVNLLDGVARDGRPLKRVRVGSFTKLTDAESTADKLAKFFKDRSVEPFITRQK